MKSFLFDFWCRFFSLLDLSTLYFLSDGQTLKRFHWDHPDLPRPVVHWQFVSKTNVGWISWIILGIAGFSMFFPWRWAISTCKLDVLPPPFLGDWWCSHQKIVVEESDNYCSDGSSSSRKRSTARQGRHQKDGSWCFFDSFTPVSCFLDLAMRQDQLPQVQGAGFLKMFFWSLESNLCKSIPDIRRISIKDNRLRR